MNFLPAETTAHEHLGQSTPSLAALQRAYGCRCNSAVFFANSHCLTCDTPLGYEPVLGRVLSLAPGSEPGTWNLAGPDLPEGKADLYRRCLNLDTPAACNWILPVSDSGESYCIACRLNRRVPDLSIPEDAILWGRVELAKRRVISACVALGLPVASRVSEDPEHGLAFDFLRSPAEGPRVLTGHDNGLITLNIEEADDVKREQMRTAMHEPYRTLVGHFRHEIGHYYWNRLVAESQWLEGFRDLFGDERMDYAEALNVNYQQGPKAGWALEHVSAYASVHPWEDWAETWAHYMHMVDTLGTASGFGLEPASMALPFDCFGPDVLYSHDSADSERFLSFVNSWLKLTAVMNELCRSMGQPDFYPFALARQAVTKLHFIHLVVCSASGRCDEAPSAQLEPHYA
ncbi:MAG TPA: putative zinc-binding metallopeptidase [Bryobacteraceae bacterium]|nr:putative zinc-binding metallopeptidase [Bryobacteraceae bacterium]